MNRLRQIMVICMIVLAAGNAHGQTAPEWMTRMTGTVQTGLMAKYGDGQRQRIQKGLRQVADFWRAEDGDATAFSEFVMANFAGDQPTLDTLFSRYEYLLEQLDGHMNKLTLEFRRQSDLDIGPIMPFDQLFAGYGPSAHINDDFFQNKIAFVVLLNFPLTTLEQRLAEGETWSRRQWAEARLARRFSRRIPAEVNLAISKAGAEADEYIAEYNIWMHHLLNDKGERLFPAKLRLLSHWNLRDEIKANYSLSDPTIGIEKQRMIQKVMERIVTQTIPAAVIDNPLVDWNPYSNELTPAAAQDSETPIQAGMKISLAPEPDARYQVLLNTFLASRKADPYSPTAPTLIDRGFNENREIPEARVEAMLKSVLSSPLVPKVAKLIESRLGRPLEPFDIWYNGFKSRGAYTEAELDAIVSKRYPTAEAYKADMPALLVQLGFSKEKAEYLASNIEVDPARGSGHAWGPGMRSETAHLRTRVEKSGMNYKGFNIAVHEMGHNVEQTFSLKDIDHTLLQGVPNTAFTEALAFVFQGHDLELLGLTKPDPKTEALKALNAFWATFEIGGVALVDMGVWHWMYDHPNATPAELKQATIKIAQDIWNQYYAPVFKTKDVVLLGIYSHMIHSFLYLPDYPIGHLIAYQIEEQMKKAGNIGPEFERMTKAGSIAPDLWMMKATGAPVGADALLVAAERALTELGKETRK
ncbi:MAG: hypothetical protein ACKVRP_01795 [Bacteroidota bacterium]